ncbi:MAG: S8 family serine peptidase [candidate division WOR-3 bacterium]
MSLPFYREPIKSIAPKIETDLVWVYFTDKGFTTNEEYNQTLKAFAPRLSPDALARRVKHNGIPADFNDLPVCQKYLDEIQALGGNLRTVSNWLNAASFRIPTSLIPEINSLPYVYDIKPVAVHKTEVAQEPFKINQSIRKSPMRPETIEETKEDTTAYRRLYGPSLEQVAMLGVPPVYFKGYTGSKVKVGFLDTGLKRKCRDTVIEALKHLDSTVISEYDFLAGDDFFITQQPNFSFPSIINNLTNLPRIKEPVISLSQTASDTIFLFYTADNFYGLETIPRRALYSTYSTDGGRNWSPPIILTPAPLGYACRYPSAVSKVNPVYAVSKEHGTYVVWQSSPLPDEKVGNIYFSYFRNLVWQNPIFLNVGKSPNLFQKGNSLYLVFIDSDNKIYFRCATIFPDSIRWEETVLVGEILENAIRPQVVIDSLNEIEVFTTGLKSGRIYHYHSDVGTFFKPRPNPVETLASNAQVYITGNTIHLLYKDYFHPPFVKIAYKRSTDGGETWSSTVSVTPDLLTIGSFSFIADDKQYVAYESYGSIYLAQSADGINWTNTPIDTQEFLYCPMFVKSRDNLSLVWFRRGDDNTDYEPEEDNIIQADHGTHMVSIVAGYKTGEIVGVAPGVDLIIAKTELHRTKFGGQGRGWAYEFTLEEDMWIAGLEWAEKKGAQIISSSLGYRSWYGDSSLDGKTAPISIAANLAAQRGLIIVSAMGNRGQDSIDYPWPKPYIVAPGDADGIITAGGVTKYRAPWRQSGTGPTIDGRMKPELVAMSDTVVVVKPDAISDIEGSAGTSDATALIAGCCALILEAHPDWTASQVKQALFATAFDPKPGPDTIINGTEINIFGYGIPNVDSVLKLYPPERPSYTQDRLLDPYPNPFILNPNNKIYFPFFLAHPTKVGKITIYTLSGERISEILLAPILRPGRYGIDDNREELERFGAVWDGKNKSGQTVGSGLYFVVLRTGYNTDVKKFAVVR